MNEIDKIKLDAIIEAYEEGRIAYEDIPENYKEYIDIEESS